MGIAASTRRLGELLIADGVTTPDMVAGALARIQTTGETLGEALVALGAVSREDVLKAVALQQNLPYLFRGEFPSVLPMLKAVSSKYLRQYLVCPIGVDAGTLTVATADPLNPLILFDQESPPRRLQAAVTSRVKLMAEMNIAERRLPQDGRIRVTLHGRRVDIRTSTIPTVHGESIVMRLLDRQSVFLPLEKLGFAPAMLPRFEGLIRRPHGIFLVTGPTGSGKTTTLYGALDKINSPDRKIITVEDPVEYQLKGVNQIAVKPKIGLTFATGLRHIVRQDPDVILIGEIRDLETAEIAIQCSLTGSSGASARRVAPPTRRRRPISRRSASPARTGLASTAAAAATSVVAPVTAAGRASTSCSRSPRTRAASSSAERRPVTSAGPRSRRVWSR